MAGHYDKPRGKGFKGHTYSKELCGFELRGKRGKWPPPGREQVESRVSTGLPHVTSHPWNGGGLIDQREHGWVSNHPYPSSLFYFYSFSLSFYFLFHLFFFYFIFLFPLPFPDRSSLRFFDVNYAHPKRRHILIGKVFSIERNAPPPFAWIKAQDKLDSPPSPTLYFTSITNKRDRTIAIPFRGNYRIVRFIY